MSSLVRPLLDSGEVQLAIVTSLPGYPDVEFADDEVTYFNIGANRVLETYGAFRKTRINRLLHKATQIAKRWAPDLIHFHGSERIFGLVRSRGMLTVPSVLSIQGIVEEIHRVYDHGIRSSDRRLAWTVSDLLRYSTPATIRQKYAAQIPLEREILAGVDALIGRTAWDHAHALFRNPSASYFHVDEMIRPPFRQASAWSLDQSSAFTVMSTSGASPIKGLPVLLEAISNLRQVDIPVRLKLAGISPQPGRSGLNRLIHRRIAELGLNDAVDILGWLPAKDLVSHLHTSRCFVTPSLMENSSNALCEAQLVGVPCVASDTGGLSSIVSHRQTGLLCSPGDSTMLAARMNDVLSNSDLAQSLSSNGRAAALQRHAPEQIVRDLLRCYRNVAESSSTPSNQVKQTSAPLLAT
ncbi:glycosyltransferase family 4 protein [Roseiconus lacunae]|uniref:Glycosyltransferase family 4 protein n=1 Tax=Roseiconus lacunae TaxID=2605694 RepID=A0ABT7PDJ0_9BACT|nr:glycosyltransferase family 4 protein [Roseiconus lacunae]MDM4014564.1 glycosyltransferase family 4 protein [Roseiconus lacunae]